MALSVPEQKLFDIARAALPAWLFPDEAVEEIVGGFAKQFGDTLQNLDRLVSMTYIESATGAWLDQHAKDRGTRRQAGETDAALSTRLRQYQDRVTLPALTANINALWVQAGSPGGTPPVIYELRLKRAFFGAQSPAEPNPGFKRAYLSRGYRMGDTGDALIVILPFGVTAPLSAAIIEALRQQKAGGIVVFVETRLH